jgi:hypothetical protein
MLQLALEGRRDGYYDFGSVQPTEDDPFEAIVLAQARRGAVDRRLLAYRREAIRDAGERVPLGVVGPSPQARASAELSGYPGRSLGLGRLVERSGLRIAGGAPAAVLRPKE